MLVFMLTFGTVGGLEVNAQANQVYEDEGKFDITFLEKEYDKDEKTMETTFDYKVSKNGVYTFSCGEAKTAYYFSITDKKDEFAFASSTEEGENFKVYLEKGRTYSIRYVLKDIATKKVSASLVVKLEKEMNFRLDINANVCTVDGKKISFSEYKKAGFNWDEKTYTLTLKNCKINGSLDIREIYPDFRYDSKRYSTAINIVLEGNNTIVDAGEEKILNCLGLDLNISGNGILNIVSDDAVIDADKLNVKNATLKSGYIIFYVDEAYFDSVKLNCAIKYVETLKGQEGYLTTRTAECDYVDYAELFSEGNNGVELNDCDINLEYDLLPEKYLKNKHIDYYAFLGCEVKNSRVNVKIQKKLVKHHKKYIALRTSQFGDFVATKWKYTPIKKSYRNALKKGMLIHTYDATYKVLKGASTDGKYIGKVEVVSTNNKGNIYDFKDKVYTYNAYFNVVKIGKNVCAGEKKVKKVILGKKIKKIAKGAFTRKGNKKIKFVVPKGMKKKFMKMLKKAKVKRFKVVVAK